MNLKSNTPNVMLAAIGLAYLAMSAAARAENVTLTLNFDSFPEDISWEIISGGAVIQSGGSRYRWGWDPQ